MQKERELADKICQELTVHTQIAKVTVLGEYIDHHVKEERTEIFTKRARQKSSILC